MATTARVPAWKRLGLKLKYAKDTADDENTPPISKSTQEPTKSSKRPAEDEGPETPAKRVKPSKAEKKKNRHASKEDEATSEPAAAKTPKKIVFDEEGQNARPSTLRKSVSFTPDTKIEDGFSASNFFKAWVNGGESNEKSQPEEAEAASPSKEPPKEKKKPKKPKKSKSTLLPSEEASTTSSKKPATKEDEATATPAYITYLQTFHTSRSTWKFSKAHQNTLLKNLFNIYRIPPTHNEAINAYIAGLQGSARQRVASDAVKILKDLAAGGDLESCCAALKDKVSEYEAAKKSGKTEAELEDLRRELERGRRAEGILRVAFKGEEGMVADLFAASKSEESKATSTPTATETALQPEEKKPQRKKRKARTDVSSFSSSSSESSSEESSSESDSDSD